jgi:hypothetical protein
MVQQFDLIVIGTGMAARVAARPDADKFAAPVRSTRPSIW